MILKHDRMYSPFYDSANDRYQAMRQTDKGMKIRMKEVSFFFPCSIAPRVYIGEL